MSSILYNDSYCIGIEELNKIYISLLTVADYVYINANVEVDWQMNPQAYKHVKKSLDTLQKKGLLIYWRYPNEKKKKSDEIIIDKNQYSMWDEIINKTFFNSEKLYSIFNYLGDISSGLSICEENTSKVLLIRREYWTYALLEILKADKVMNFFSGWMPDYEGVSSITTEKVEDIAIRSVFTDTSMSVFALEAEDIVALHKKNKRLRDSLNKKMRQPALTHNDMISRLLEEAVQANQEIIQNKYTAFTENNVNLAVTLAGVAANLTPVGFIFNQMATTKDMGQGLYNAVKALYGEDADRNIFYILIKMKQNVNKSLRRAKNNIA